MKTTRKRKYKEKHREFLKEQISVFLESGNKIKKDVKVEKKRHQSYVKSVYWAKRKEDYYKKFNISSCEVCQAKENLQVHHNNYVTVKDGHWGYEDDSHLIVLCRPCHVLFHQHSKPISYVVFERSGFAKYASLDLVQKCCNLCGQKAKYSVKSRQGKGIFMCEPCTLIFKEQLNQNNNGKGTPVRDLTTKTPTIFRKQVRKPTVVRRRNKSRKEKISSYENR